MNYLDIVMVSALIALGAFVVSVILAIFIWSISRSAKLSWDQSAIVKASVSLLPIAMIGLLLGVVAYIMSGEARDSDGLGIEFILVATLMTTVIAWPASYFVATTILRIPRRKK